MELHMLNVFLNNLISEIDDEEMFSDDDDLLEAIITSTHKNKRNSIKNYWEITVENYNNEEFKGVFRVSRSVFNLILSKMVNSDVYSFIDDRSINVDKQLGVYFYFAGHEACSFRSLRDRFDISLSTVHSIIKKVSYFLSFMSEEHINWPNYEEKLVSVESLFSKTGFPDTFGCLDGTHVRWEPPKHKVAEYMNRKKQTSIQVQGICDHKKRFIDVFLGFPGRVHDSRVFQNSDIYQDIDTKCEGNIWHF